jgi:regulator of RNase E activity RraA
MTENYSNRLQDCYTGAVYDVLRTLGYNNQVLPSYIRPLNGYKRIAGQVYTVEGRLDKTVDRHNSLLHWCKMLSIAPGGRILICQPNDHTIAHMGELSSETLAFKKVKGYIVDGGCRDIAFIEKIGFPVFCKYFTPRDVVETWIVTALGEPIEIDNIRIRTDDYVLADADGIIIIPFEIIGEVVIKTEDVLRTENKVRTAILQGVDPVEAYLKFGKF